MKIHVLPGDALTETFSKTRIDGETIVCRECLVEGAVGGETLEDFWQTRAGFIAQTYGGEKAEYFQRVAGEFERLKELAAPGAEINLWFEHELFCQANLWFTVNFLRETKAKIFRVAPLLSDGKNVWKGFGALSSGDLERCFAARVELNASDIARGAQLWRAFQHADYEALEMLSRNGSPAFPFLKEVCAAEIEKNTRPREILREILAGGKNEFSEIFPEFSARAGVYGFGDAQVKRILAGI